MNNLLFPLNELGVSMYALAEWVTMMDILIIGEKKTVEW